MVSRRKKASCLSLTAIVLVSSFAIAWISRSTYRENKQARALQRIGCGIVNTELGAVVVVFPGSEREIERMVQLIEEDRLLWGIDISETGITNDDLAHLAVLDQIRSLNISYTRITDDGLKHLQHLGSLEELILDGCYGITGTKLDEVAKLQTLKQLQMGGTRIRSTQLRHLKPLATLKSLDLGFTDIDDQCINHLLGLPELEELRLHGTSVSDAIVPSLPQLSNLRVLHLTRTQISDQGIPHLLQLPNLRMLDIRSTPITRDGGDRLRKGLPECVILQ